jgi:hypothetical protein
VVLLERWPPEHTLSSFWHISDGKRLSTVGVVVIQSLGVGTALFAYPLDTVRWP